MNHLTGMMIYTEEEVVRAFRNHLGNYNLVAAELNVSRGQLMTYLMEHPEVRQERQQIRESVKDDMEHILIEKAKTDNNLLMFYLRTQAPERGYGASATLKGDSNNPLQVNVNARTLIAAMKAGATEERHESQEDDEVSDLFERSGLLPGGMGS